MADRYLLESGSPDGYLLEDSSGVLLLEAGTVQWSISDKSPDASTSNANLTASVTATIGSVRANVPGTGKFYFEVNVDAVGSTYAVGVADETAPTLTGSWFGSSGNPHGATMRSETSVEYNGGSSAIGPTYTTADVIGVAVDVPNKLIWWAKNNVWQLSGDPALGTGGKSLSSLSSTIFPAFQGAFSTETATGHFTAASQTYAAPSGFTAIDSTVQTHATTGALTGPGSTISGTAAHIAIHTTTGVLTGPGSTIAGTAVYNAKHPSTGALIGPGSTVAGSAARTREHAATGVLTGPGSVIVGAAVYNAKHTTTGALTGPGSTVAGSATRFRAFATSGVLVGPGSSIVGSADHTALAVTVHATSGALVGQPSIIDGIAARTRQHDTSGVLTGPPALVVGVVTRWRDHDTSGALLGVTGVVFGRAFNGTPQLHDIPVDGDNLTDEPASPAGNLGLITEPSGQIVNHPPYPAA